MRSSSARQLEFDYSETPNVLSAPPAPAPDTDTGTSAPFRVPHFGVSNQVYAAVARSAGRVNAASVSEEEHNLLLRERQTLLDKQFGGTITRKEQNRLEYVRWSLDRIEDAKHGQTLDVLEGWVQRYEQFLSQMRNFETQLAQQMPHGKRGRK
jgi:hypothetical protein